MSDIFLHLTDGAKIVATEHVVPNADTTALILHGFFSSRKSANCIAAAESFAAQGISAIAVDFYGRGDSDGAFGDLTIAKGVETVIACIAHIQKNKPQQKIILTGGSFGGLIALHAAAQLDNIALLILRAPVSDWRSTWLEWLKPEQFIAWKESGVHHDKLPDGRAVTFGIEFYNDIFTANVYTDIAPSIKVPTLIVHGTADETVPLLQTETLHAVLMQSEMIVLQGADHQFSDPVHLKAYQDALRTFITAHLK